MQALIQHIQKLAALAHCNHFWLDEDGWWNCPLSAEGCPNPDIPKDKCTCGADAHNAEVQKVVDEIMVLLQG